MRLRALHTILLILMAVIMAGVSQSCGSSRNAEQSAITTGQVHSPADAKAQLRSIVSTYDQWQRLRMPVTIRLKSPQNASISGQAIFERDNSVFISLRFLGFEVANIYATADSIFVIDKYNKQYAAEDISRFLSGTPVHINNLQDLLLGHAFTLGQSNIKADKFSKSDFDVTSPNSWSLIPGNQPSAAEYGFAFQPANRLANTVIQTSNHQPITITYTAPVETKRGPIAQSVLMSYSAGKKALEAEFIWSPDKAVWDSDVELRKPSITSKYRRITADKIALMLSKL